MAKSKQGPDDQDEPQATDDPQTQLQAELEALREERKAMAKEHAERMADLEARKAALSAEKTEYSELLKEFRGTVAEQKKARAEAVTAADRKAVEHNQEIEQHAKAGLLKYTPQLFAVRAIGLDVPAVEVLASDPSEAIRVAAICYDVTDTSKYNWRVQAVKEPSPQAA